VTDRPVILWFRQDLRLSDHPALCAAIATGRPVIPVYVLDDASPGRWAMGGASRWWLGMSLPRLALALAEAGSRLVIRRGPAVEELAAIARETQATGVYFSRSIEPWAARLEVRLKEALEAEGVETHRYAGCLLFEPERIRNRAGEPFRVYTPFARALEALGEPRAPQPRPVRMLAPARWPQGLAIEDLDLLPQHPDWAGGLRKAWTPGEAGAVRRLEAFVGGPIRRYAEQRDRPDVAGTSRLSPHLHFGEISAAAVWHATAGTRGESGPTGASVAKFRREIIWREFSYHLLHHFPDLPEAPFRPEFRGFPWRSDPAALAAWQRGRTGYPIVDAGMRELWHSGYMHNRVRMIAASFLVKDLLVPWQDGAAWFWDTLVDADLANNSASWQWVAGSGSDAAPFFRIFNPVKQGLEFDPQGDYVRAWVPELARLPIPHLHAPFAAPAEVLAAAGVTLGVAYPRPIVDHQSARQVALDAFARIKGG
jgi:deoxyribodipyrimidine photo-lyase